MPLETQQLKRALDACKAYVREAMLPNNSESAVSEAERLIWLLYREEPGAAEVVREHAFTQFIAKMVEANRKKEAKARAKANPSQMRLPGFELLPIYIHVFDERVALRNAIYSQVREFVSQLVGKYRKMADSDQQLKQARELAKRMKAHAGRGATVADVLGL